MEYPDIRLLVFAKAPEPGEVKTRLVPRLGPLGAAELYSKMAEYCISQAALAELCPIELWCSPTTDHRFFSRCENEYGVTLKTQCSGGLGDRMAHAMGSALERGTSTLLIGTDCPSITTEDLRQACQLLEKGADVVLGPTEDSGYCLLGLREVSMELFDNMNWGSPDVLPVTRQRIQHLGLVCREIATRWDVDRPEDIERLKSSGIMQVL